jgi:hypothetical protein
MHAAVKLQVTIPKDRRVQLPDDLPEGEAEIIVLYPADAELDEASPEPLPRAGEPTDYFARLTSRQPGPLSSEASRALDEADRGER